MISGNFIISAVIFWVALFFGVMIWSIRKTAKNESVVVTFYNCEDRVENDLRMLIKSNPQSSLVIVDLGSEDETLKIIKKIACEYENIKVIPVNEK